jgi:hypothetical protein
MGLMGMMGLMTVSRPIFPMNRIGPMRPMKCTPDDGWNLVVRS